MKVKVTAETVKFRSTSARALVGRVADMWTVVLPVISLARLFFIGTAAAALCAFCRVADTIL